MRSQAAKAVAPRGARAPAEPLEIFREFSVVPSTADRLTLDKKRKTFGQAQQELPFIAGAKLNGPWGALAPLSFIEA